MLIKRTLLYLPSQLLSPLAQFLSILLWTYYCDSITIGIITLITTQQELIRTIFVSWWSHFIIRFFNDKELSGKSMEQSNVAVIFYACLLQSVAAYFTFLFVFKDQGNIYQLVATVAFVVLRAVNQHNVSLAAARNDAISYNVLSLCGPVIGLVVGIVLLKTYGNDPLYPLTGYAFGESLAIVFSLIRAKCFYSPFRINKNIFILALKYGMPILVSGTLAWLALNVSRYIIESQLGLAAVGSYAVGFGLGQRAAGIAAMLVTSAALPLAISVMQNEGEQKAMEQLSRNCTLLMTVMFPALVGMFAVNDLLVKLLVAPEFWESTLDILPWAILSGGLFGFIYNYLSHYFFVMAKPKSLIIIDGSLALLIALLSVPLISFMGLKGGVVAMVLSSALITIILLSYLLIKTNFIFPWRSFFYICFSVTMMYLTVLLIRSYFDGLILQLISSIIFGGLVYCIFVAYSYRDQVLTFASRLKTRG